VRQTEEEALERIKIIKIREKMRIKIRREERGSGQKNNKTVQKEKLKLNC
jgi:hypothetical protein